MTSDSTGDYGYTIMPANTTTTGGVGWTSASVPLPYVTTTTTASTWGSSISIDAGATACQFCDKNVELGLFIKSKAGIKTFVCAPCAKDCMGGDKIKELLDLIEPLAAMAEVAKS